LGKENVPTTSSKIGTCNEKAVAYLLPFIEEEKAGGESTSAGKILLATVKVMFTILVKISFR
jgi:hypothetical protein